MIKQYRVNSGDLLLPSGKAVTVPAGIIGIIGAHHRVKWGVVMGGRRAYGWWYLVVRLWWEPSCALPGTERIIAL